MNSEESYVVVNPNTWHKYGSWQEAYEAAKTSLSSETKARFPNGLAIYKRLAVVKYKDDPFQLTDVDATIVGEIL